MEGEFAIGSTNVKEKYFCSDCEFPYDPHRFGECIVCGCTKIEVSRVILCASVSGVDKIDVKVPIGRL